MSRLSLAVVVVLLACATTRPQAPPEPEEARQVWIKALQSADSSRVWALMSKDSRARFSTQEGFDIWFHKHGPALLIQAMSATSATTVAVVRGGVRVVRENDRFAVQHSLVGGPASTPRQAVEQFVHEWRIPTIVAAAFRQRHLRFLALLRVRLEQGELRIGDEEKNIVITLVGGGSLTLSRNSEGWIVTDWTLPK